MSITNLNFLPQSPNALVNDAKFVLRLLNLIHFFAQQTIITIKDFMCRRYYKFDPQVGENLCQIRAYKIFLLSFSDDKELEKDILQKKINEVESIDKAVLWHINEFENLQSKKDKYKSNQGKLASFLSQKGMIYKLSSSLYFLCISHFLTRFKKIDGYAVYIDYEKLRDKSGMSKHFSRRIIHNFQVYLAEFSSEFILKLVPEVPKLNELCKFIAELQYYDDDNRMVLPCYYVTKILLGHCLYKRKFTLSIIADRYLNNKLIDFVYLIFEVTKDGYISLIKKNDIEKFKDRASIIIKGITVYECVDDIESEFDFIKKIEDVGVLKIILFYMAKHRQYPGKKWIALFEDPFCHLLEEKMNLLYSSKTRRAEMVVQNSLIKEIEEIRKHRAEIMMMAKMAEKIGCCNENPRLFFIKHIYCDTIQHLIEVLPSGIKTCFSKEKEIVELVD